MKDKKITAAQVAIGSAILIVVSSLAYYWYESSQKKKAADAAANRPATITPAAGKPPVVVPPTNPVINPKVNLGKAVLIYDSDIVNLDWSVFGRYKEGNPVGNIVGTNGDWYVVDFYGAGNKYVSRFAVKIL